jgi:hypothetical protein
MKKLPILLVFGLLFFTQYRGLQAQDFIKQAQVHGNFQADAQYYNNDAKLGISDSSLNGKKLGMNGFGNIIYSYDNFSAGLRFESYMTPMAGFSSNYEGSGIPYWFATYKNDDLEVTLGHFYEQFGSGMVLRSYQEWSLGFDNSINGIRAKFSPVKGISLKGLIGHQRDYWVPYENGNRGIIRGFDAEISLNETFSQLAKLKTQIILGGSFVSKYEKMTTKTLLRELNKTGGFAVYEYKLPQNVGSYAGRLNLIHGGWNFMTEYARKSSNPSALNNYIYRQGQGLYSVLSYSQKGLGIEFSAKRIDNMGFKSRMTEKENILDINFLPPLTFQHHYSLASMYPYGTQPNGEFSVHGGLEYTFKKNSALGGKYGTTIETSYTLVKSIKKEQVSSTIPIDSTGTEGYTSPFFSFGEKKFYEDFNIQLTKKISSTFKMNLAYLNIVYDKDVIEGHLNEYGKIYSNIGIADMTFKLSKTNSLRVELQGLFTNQDKGNWAAGTLEFTVAPKWVFSVQDEYNYGNDVVDNRLHYFNAAVAYTKNTTRLGLSYGRQREGLLCVGGVCRYVPAANGITLTLTSSF